MRTLITLWLSALSLISAAGLRAESPAGRKADTPTAAPVYQPHPSAECRRSERAELRGTWIQTAWQDRYTRMSPAECRQYLTRLVDRLAECGLNAIIFQVRPEGDAFYHSEVEPWSRFLTGRQGVAPQPEWDPMAYLIELCHARGMEFHAWLNPYRITMSKSMQLAPGHLYKSHPEYFVTYDGRLYLNPGLPESRAHIRRVVTDIATRYDVDAIHMDDYFYPYPVEGQTFDDTQAWQTYAPQMGLSTTTRQGHDDFRRRSVDILIKSVHDDLRSVKPWVRFGVSPFGIYRNRKSWADGSETNGTQCYDDLYADVLFWMQSGWVDYVVPQLYWEIGHKAADYETLVRWWDRHCPPTCQLYIGQSIERSLDAEASTQPDLRTSNDHLSRKLALARQREHVFGQCFWYAYQIDDDAFHVGELMRESVFAEPTLLPPFTTLDDRAPAKVYGAVASMDAGGASLRVAWQPTDTLDPWQRPHSYNVYRAERGVRTRDGRKVTRRMMRRLDLALLWRQTDRPEVHDAEAQAGHTYTYIITAVDACHNEGAAVKKKVKLVAPKQAKAKRQTRQQTASSPSDHEATTAGRRAKDKQRR